MISQSFSLILDLSLFDWAIIGTVTVISIILGGYTVKLILFSPKVSCNEFVVVFMFQVIKIIAKFSYIANDSKLNLRSSAIQKQPNSRTGHLHHNG